MIVVSKKHVISDVLSIPSMQEGGLLCRPCWTTTGIF